MSQLRPEALVSVNGSRNTTILEISASAPEWHASVTISELAPVFLRWARYEMRRSPVTIDRYREALGWVVRDLGDLRIGELHRGHLMHLGARIEARGCGPARAAGIFNSIRSLLRFAAEVARMPCLDYRDVRIPRVPRRDVIYLTTDEVQRLREAILGSSEDWESAPMGRLRLRAVVEVLLGTGARISEALALDRTTLSFERREARVIGKGRKERVLFFTEDALEWVRRYLARRRDDEEPVFVTRYAPVKRLSHYLVKDTLTDFARRAGIVKRVTPHILRHTMATTLLFNGCPIGHIKELLGHERLDTTCRYYLGLDRRAAKAAHDKFLKYDRDAED
jgi:integrase/recombinase XerD